MDQASLLREMMKKKQKANKIPFGILYLGDEKKEEVVGNLIEEIKQTNKNICILKNLKGTEKIIIETEQKTGLNFERIIKEEETIREEIINIIERKEKKYEQVVIEAGNGVNYSTANAMLLVNEALIIMDNTEESEKRLLDYISILTKLKKKQRVAVVVEIEKDIENKINKIQEKVWDEFNYYIEVIGIFEKDEEIKIEDLNLARYAKESEEEEEKISISLKNRFI